MLKITDPKMAKKMDRALKHGGDLYTFEHVSDLIDYGRLQTHVMGDTWIVTEVHDFPNKRTVNILLVVGKLQDAIRAEKNIEMWARSIGADAITAIGRRGWQKFYQPGWKEVGTLYRKELSHEQ